MSLLGIIIIASFGFYGYSYLRAESIAYEKLQNIYGQEYTTAGMRINSIGLVNEYADIPTRKGEIRLVWSVRTTSNIAPDPLTVDIDFFTGEIVYESQWVLY